MDFQDRIRERFPLYKEELYDAYSPPVPQDIAHAIGSPFARHKKYDFSTDDETWGISLTSDALSLTTSHYKKWEGFQEKLDIALKALVDIYQPAFYSRIGLRYIDVIKRSELGISAIPWGRLFQQHVVGDLADDNVGNKIKQTVREAVIELANDDGHVLFRHGIRYDGNEQCYVIDADFFAEGKIILGDTYERLRIFNEKAGRLFRWCITDELASALQPQQDS